jgi:endonuclease-3 related protein
MSERAIQEIDARQLEQLIRPAGFFRQKTATLKRLGAVLNARGSLAHVLGRNTTAVRSELLQVKGIGPETADSILLYAGGHEIFVVDIYLRRWLARTGLQLEAKLPYERLREFVEAQIRTAQDEYLPMLRDLHSDRARHEPTAMSRMARSPVADLFSEIHAALVAEGIANKSPASVAGQVGDSRQLFRR